MDIDSATFKITLNYDDANTLFYVIYQNLVHSIKNHYNQLQQNKDGEDIFFDYEAHLLKKFKFFASIINRVDMYEAYIDEFERMFKKRREERENKED